MGYELDCVSAFAAFGDGASRGVKPFRVQLRPFPFWRPPAYVSSLLFIALRHAAKRFDTGVGAIDVDVTGGDGGRMTGQSGAKRGKAGQSGACAWASVT